MDQLLGEGNEQVRLYWEDIFFEKKVMSTSTCNTYAFDSTFTFQERKLSRDGNLQEDFL